jgi:hypothetical protein
LESSPRPVNPTNALQNGPVYQSNGAPLLSKAAVGAEVRELLSQPVKKVIRLRPPEPRARDTERQPVVAPSNNDDVAGTRRKERVKCKKCYCQVTRDQLEEHMKAHQLAAEEVEDGVDDAMGVGARRPFSSSDEEAGDDESGQWRCPSCYLVLPASKKSEHVTLALCWAEKHYNCRFCNSMFVSLESRKEHEVSDHGLEGKNVFYLKRLYRIDTTSICPPFFFCVNEVIVLMSLQEVKSEISIV